MDTQAFHFVLRTYFFTEHLEVLLLTLPESHVLHLDHGIGNEFAPLEHTGQSTPNLKGCKKLLSTLMAAARTADCQILGDPLEENLKALGYSR